MLVNVKLLQRERERNKCVCVQVCVCMLEYVHVCLCVCVCVCENVFSEATCLTVVNDVQHYSVMSCRKASQNSAHLYCVLLFRLSIFFFLNMNIIGQE